MVDERYVDVGDQVAVLGRQDGSVANEHLGHEGEHFTAVIEGRANQTADSAVHPSARNSACPAFLFKCGTEVLIRAYRHRKRTLLAGCESGYRNRLEQG